MTAEAADGRVKNRFLRRANGLIEGLESPRIPFSHILATFFFAATLRNFLETYLNGEIASPDLLAELSHYYLSYACLAMALIILFHFATKVPVAKVARVILPSFIILILPPLGWILVPGWRNFGIGYLFPDTHPGLFWRFLTFFGPLEGSGVTQGMRLEIALATAGSFIYFLIKGKDILRSLLFAFLTYTVIFLYCALPFAYTTLMHILGLDDVITVSALTDFLLFLALALGAGQFYLYNKIYFLEILKDIRFLRLLHFELMFVLGIALSRLTYPQSFAFSSFTFFHGIFLMTAVAFAWAFAVTSNNIADHEIDAVSNPRRPTITGSIPAGHYRYFPWLFLVLATVYAAAVGLPSLLLVLFFMGNYFLYSMPPLRLKRLTFFSKLFISLNSLAIILLGQLFHSGSFALPLGVIFFFLVCMTAALNFIDIKDYEGDKKAGIKTLPVVLGLNPSKKLIGLFFMISYLAACFLFPHALVLLPLAAGLGLVQFFLINKKSYQEGPVLGVYLLSVVAFILLLR